MYVFGILHCFFFCFCLSPLGWQIGVGYSLSDETRAGQLERAFTHRLGVFLLDMMTEWPCWLVTTRMPIFIVGHCKVGVLVSAVATLGT